MLESRTNIDPVDFFTIVHFAFGLWAGQLVTPTQVMLGMSAFEVAERPLKRAFPRFFVHPGQDSLANSVVDVLAAWLGAVVIRANMRREGIQ